MVPFIECLLQGNYAEAQPLLKRALAINENALGVDHMTTITCRELMGGLYMLQGFFDQASILLDEVLRTRERLHGPDSAWVARALGNQAHLLSAQVRAEHHLHEIIFHFELCFRCV